MEAQIAAADEQLVPGLHFRLPAAASSILSRTPSTFYAVGGNQYSPTGVRVIRFQISDGHSFLDPSTVRLAFTIRNDDGAHILEPLANTTPLCVFQRYRCLLNGTLVEDVNLLHRTETMFELLQPEGRRLRDAHLGWGCDAPMQWTGSIAPDTLAGGATRKVLCKPLSGLLNQHLMIPLRFAPLTLEFEINPLVEHYLRKSVGADAGARSTAYTILDARIIGDVLEIDPAVVEQMNSHLKNGGTLPITFSSWFSTFNTLPGVDAANGAFAVQIARSYSRIKTIYLTWTTGETVGADAWEATKGESNWFPWPCRPGAAGNEVNDYAAAADTMELSIHVGAERIPQYPIRSLAEFAYHLQKAIGMSASAEGLSILPKQYRSTQFVAALDLEKAPSAEFSGLSTRSGETIRIEAKNLNVGNAAKVVTGIYVCLEFSAVAAVRLTGVDLLD